MSINKVPSNDTVPSIDEQINACRKQLSSLQQEKKKQKKPIGEQITPNHTHPELSAEIKGHVNDLTLQIQYIDKSISACIHKYTSEEELHRNKYEEESDKRHAEYAAKYTVHLKVRADLINQLTTYRNGFRKLCAKTHDWQRDCPICGYIRVWNN